MSQVLLQNVSRRYGDVIALHPTDLQIAEGEFLTLLGPSGCGKTTTLRMIAGFITPSTGRIFIDDEDVTDLPPQRRTVGMVFQDYALFPHLTIADNIGFGLRERRVPRKQARERVAELLDLIQLPQIAERYPAEISGGQQQRVALARAIAYPPRVLLMDEPLGALDLKLRETMQLELRRLQRELGITTIFVTHDQTEAMNLSDTIAVMGAGRVLQRGTPQEIYDRPSTRFVADFIGQINFLDGELAGRNGDWTMLRTADRAFRTPTAPANAGVAGAGVAGAVTLAIRPERLSVATGTDIPPGLNRIGGAVVGQVFHGNFRHLKVEIPGALWTVELRPDEQQYSDGDPVMLTWSPEQAVVLYA